jgi:signal transduction histidine kinase/streptogramin lyase
MIHEDRQGTLWSIGPHNLIGKFDRIKKTITYVRDPAFPKVRINGHAMYEDRAGTMWFGTTSLGAIKFDPAQKAFTNFTAVPFDENSLNWRAVGGIYEDRSGVLWVATPLGLNKFNPAKDGTGGSFTHYTHDPMNPQSLSAPTIWPILEDRKGTLWLGTLGGGLEVFDRAKKVFVHHKHDPGNPQSLAYDEVSSLFEDRSGTLWIGLQPEGLDEYDRTSGTFVHHKHNPNDPNTISTGQVHAVLEDRLGTLWIGTQGGGLNRFNQPEGSFKHYTHDPRNLESLSNIAVQSIFEDRRGNVWIGTSAGLNRFDRATESFTAVTIKDGLASDYICGILEDDGGCLWLNTAKGISKFDPQTGALRNYDESDGVKKSQCYAPSAFKNSKGEMFFGGINGFVRFYPDSIRDNPYVPPVVITVFRKVEKIVQLDSATCEKKEISLLYRENMFSFEFAALNYTNPEKNQYAYMLEGFDQDWIYSGTRRYATYTNLDPGKYTFRVKGSNNDGIWNVKGASIAVIITPPFWKTWWFTVAFWMTIVGSIGGTVRYVEMRKLKQKIERLEREQALERERSRISLDMHDEVGANLTKIAIMSELAMKASGATDGTAKQLQNISQTAREVIDSISAIVWSINPKNDKLDNLAGYIREYASEIFEITPIQCRFDFPDEVPSIPLTAEARRSIFLTMKEALNNIVKHSAATRVEIGLEFKEGQIELRINDEGKGFAPQEPSRYGNGLINMRKRIEDIGGNFEMASQPGQGTKIRLTVPVA